MKTGMSEEKKNELPKHLSQNKFSYGNFLKTSTLLNGTLVQEHKSNVPKIEKNEENVQPTFLTDEELFKICNGRTAHKGARHGLKLNGKLKRLEEQERNFLQMHETLPINLSSKEEEGTSKKSRSSRKRKRRINDLTHQLDILCNIDDTVDTSKLKGKKARKEKKGLVNNNVYGNEKEEEDKEIDDMLLPTKEQLDNWVIRKNRKLKEDRSHGSTHKTKKRKKEKNKNYQTNNFNIKNEIVQCQSQETDADIVDSILHTELPHNESPLSSNKDVNSIPYSCSSDTYTRNEANELNYKISKKKKAKLRRKQSKVMQNIIENFEVITVSTENVPEEIDRKKKLRNLIEKLADNDIAIDKTKEVTKIVKNKKANKRKNKNIRKMEDYLDKKATSGRK
ncbi:uncharacterized protein LOC144468135 isoform X2 [Augochlora pura]